MQPAKKCVECRINMHRAGNCEYHPSRCLPSKIRKETWDPACISLESRLLKRYKESSPSSSWSSLDINIGIVPPNWPFVLESLSNFQSYQKDFFHLKHTPVTMTCNSSPCSVISQNSGKPVDHQNTLPPIVKPSIKIVPVSFLLHPQLKSELTRRQMTGVRCPTCAANGQEVWVIPGRACAYCGTHC